MLATLILLASGHATPINDAPDRAPSHSITAGISQLLVLSAYASSTSRTFDIELTGQLTGPWQLGGGARWGPQLKEGYMHLVIAPEFEWYVPQAGFELGVTTRGQFAAQSGVLSEFREESLRGHSPLYFALRAEPFGVRISSLLRLRFVGLYVGAHASPTGRILRCNLRALSLEATW